MTSKAPPGDCVSLLYRGLSTAHVRGSVTGRLYLFSCATPVLQVDPRDAATMLQYSFFRRLR
jgi:hypothetical protein